MPDESYEARLRYLRGDTVYTVVNSQRTDAVFYDGRVFVKDMFGGFLEVVDLHFANTASKVSTAYTVWTRRDGTRVPLTDMSIGHLVSTVALVERADRGSLMNVNAHWLESLKAELNSRGWQEKVAP